MCRRIAATPDWAVDFVSCHKKGGSETCGACGGRNVRPFGRGRTQSGCWPSWAFHAHSVIFMSVNTALKLESSGLQA